MEQSDAIRIFQNSGRFRKKFDFLVKSIFSPAAGLSLPVSKQKPWIFAPARGLPILLLLTKTMKNCARGGPLLVIFLTLKELWTAIQRPAIS